MGVSINIAATNAMDLYYANYRSSADFYTLEDFKTHCAGILSNIYTQGYQEKYAEFRQEKRDDIVAFDPATLNRQTLKVERRGSQLVSKLERQVMSFPFDTFGVGLQELLPIKPSAGVRLERTTLAASWQVKLVPQTNIIWWYLVKDEVRYINNGICNLSEVEGLYVPSISEPDFEVPDGVAEFIITTAAATIKTGANGVIVKKSLDGNYNRTLETEINKESLK